MVQDLVEDWNNVIPFKIKEQDFQNPSEKFLFKALISLLKELCLNVTEFENMYSEPEDVMHDKKIQFLKVVNTLYHRALNNSTKKNNKFLYMDYIKPTSKMTTHLLRQLHNYLLYINYVKVSALEKVNKVVEKNISNKNQLNNAKREHEKWKISELQFTKNIEQNENEIASTRAEIAKILVKDKFYENESIDLKRIISEKQENMLKLNEEYNYLKSQLISDQESNNLHKNQEMLSNEITGYEEKENLLHQNLSENAKRIASIISFSAKLNNLIAFKSSLDGSVKAANIKFENARIAINRIEKEVSNVSKENEILRINMESLKTYVQNIRLEYDQMLKNDHKDERMKAKAIACAKEMDMEYEKNSKSQIETINRMKVEMEIIKKTADQVEHYINSMKQY